jgi:hypothetical protein
MIRTARPLLALGLMTAILLACSTGEHPGVPTMGLPVSALNRDIRLVAPPSINSFKIGKEVNVLILAEPDAQVWLAADFGARMFVLRPRDKQWSEVSEVKDTLPNLLPTSLSGTPKPAQLILGTQGEALKQVGLSLLPQIENREQPVTLMIGISGYIYRDGSVTQEKVGAYTIIHLVP